MRFDHRRFPFALTAERALACARVLRVGGQAMPVMHDVDLLSVLAMHGARHLYERLEWLAGVTRLLVARHGEAERLVAHAESLRARRMLLVSAAAPSFWPFTGILRSKSAFPSAPTATVK